MDTIEVVHTIGDNTAIRVLRDNEVLYRYDVWKGFDGLLRYILISQHSNFKDIAVFKVKEVKVV
jgi:hypothetical protein